MRFLVLAILAAVTLGTSASIADDAQWTPMHDNAVVDEFGSLPALDGDAASVFEWLDQQLQDNQVAQVCCKICRRGKACGNSCISRSYRCHQPPGCACDG